METNIANILSELVISTAKHFNLSSEDAIAAVAQSHIANELATAGNIGNLTQEQLCNRLFNEIAFGL